MIFALGFVIAVGICLCIPQVWSKVETYFGRRAIYESPPVETKGDFKSYESEYRQAMALVEQLKINNQELVDNNQELVDNNQKLADQILELKSQAPKEVIKEVHIPAPAEDPRLEPAVDTLLEHLKFIPDPGDMAKWRENYLSAVHKIANIRAFDLQNENVEQKVAELDPNSLKYTPVI